MAVSTIVVELKMQHANMQTMSVSQSVNKLLVKVQILDQRHLVQQTMGDGRTLLHFPQEIVVLINYADQ